MKQALFFETQSDGQIRCNLCPRFCIISHDKCGNCRVRCNNNGILFSSNYGRLTAINTDPIEKKPLYHFYPGSNIFSIGSAGCNFHCRFCQNFEISQSSVQELLPNTYTPKNIVESAFNKTDNIGIAYTYNEPTVFFEFMMDTARLAKDKGLKNVVVTNGFINPEPLESLCDFTDAFNVDLKSFSESIYKDMAGGALAPILKNLKFLRTKQKHLEIAHLVVTDMNDQINDFKEMIRWISSELGQETILHISRYFPRYRYSSPPTPESKLMEFYEVAKEKLLFVYLGNTSGKHGHHTTCPGCNKIVIRREGYSTDISELDGSGHCCHCGRFIAVQ
jgi:pyruvate formate lyase activating enzyme